MPSTMGIEQADEIRHQYQYLREYRGMTRSLEDYARTWIAIYANQWREEYIRLGRPPVYEEYSKHLG